MNQDVEAGVLLISLGELVEDQYRDTISQSLFDPVQLLIVPSMKTVKYCYTLLVTTRAMCPSGMDTIMSAVVEAQRLATLFGIGGTRFLCYPRDEM